MTKIWISTGVSKLETHWKNVEIKWSTLLDKLQKPVVTKETLPEYLALTKAQQADVKDVGGFVGGVISGGRRLKGSVSARYLITLDVDYASLSFLDDLQLVYGREEVVLYGTHKYTKESPRMRLIMPLDREVHADEYEAIARRIAGNLGIELFDPTTFQPERLMYWPSISTGADYMYWHQTGDWIRADEVLGEYHDWRDVSQWPVSEKAKKAVQIGIDRQEEPTEKGGMVGVFCRTYGVSGAIEKYLPHVYEKVENAEDRYTYLEGSTSAGVIVYEDKFSFSHHATDPTSGRLCNAFDLVRIHLFGDSDDRVDVDTPTNKKPSYNKMVEKMLEDPKIKRQVVSEKVEDRLKATETIVPNGTDWREKVETDKKGNILNTIANIVLIMEHDEGLKGTMAYDDLQNNSIVTRDLPWRRVNKMRNLLVDSDEAQLRNYMELLYGITNRDKIRDAIEIVVRNHLFHPVKQYLEGCVWDGKERLERLFVDKLGAEDSEYTREVTKKTFVAAVKRVYEPGCKFDHMPVLVGAQGIGKSRLIRSMGREWYSDTFGNIQTKEAMENIQGVWIMEVGELAGFKRQEIEAIKLFIAKQDDQFRVAYARRVDKFLRQCIFIGSTNEDEFLHDQTGNRRFWPIKCSKKMYKDIDPDEVRQLWGEACYLYTMGEDLYLAGLVEDTAKLVQEQYTEQSDWFRQVQDYLEIKIPTNWYEMNKYDRKSFLNGDETVGEGIEQRDWVTVIDIWEDVINGQIKDLNAFNSKTIRNVMNKMPGWEKRMINKKPHGHQRGWIRVGGVLDTRDIALVAK